MPEVRDAKVSDVRTEFDRRYATDDPDPLKASEAKRKAFKRALDQLSPTKFGAGSLKLSGLSRHRVGPSNPVNIDARGIRRPTLDCSFT